MDRLQKFGSMSGLTRQIVILAGPLVLQNLPQILLGVVDTYFVSRIGTQALAAVGLASVMFFAVLMLFRGTANSTVVFVGRAYGGGQQERIGPVVWRSLNMVIWLSLFVAVLPWLFGLLMSVAAPSDSPAVRDLGTSYLQIRAFEIPLVMFSAVVWGFLVGQGNSRTPMILAWVTVLTNMLLDWMLVLGNLGAPALGVEGAAAGRLPRARRSSPPWRICARCCSLGRGMGLGRRPGRGPGSPKRADPPCGGRSRYSKTIRAR